MTDIETLRREFEAACKTEPLSKYRIEGSLDWNECGQCYYYSVTQQLFVGFCAGRQAAQAKAADAIERYRNSGKFADSFPEECIDDLLAIAADYDRLKEASRAEIEELKAKLKPHEEDPGGYLAVGGFVAEIERLQAIIDRLPKFANGDPAFHGAEAWHPHFRFNGRVVACTECDPATKWFGVFAAFRPMSHKPLSECYPTREAMEKAKGQS